MGFWGRWEVAKMQWGRFIRHLRGERERRLMEDFDGTKAMHRVVILYHRKKRTFDFTTKAGMSTHMLSPSINKAEMWEVHQCHNQPICTRASLLFFCAYCQIGTFHLPTLLLFYDCQKEYRYEWRIKNCRVFFKMGKNWTHFQWIPTSMHDNAIECRRWKDSNP